MRNAAIVLIPARNEAATIGQVVRGCVAAGFSVTVIDDASTDATALLAAQAGAEVLTHSGPHHGKTAALHLALTRLPASAEWLLFLDGWAWVVDSLSIYLFPKANLDLLHVLFASELIFMIWLLGWGWRISEPAGAE